MCNIAVAPSRERGLKSTKNIRDKIENCVAPSRERGLKYAMVQAVLGGIGGRSFTGAWIEIFRLRY